MKAIRWSLAILTVVLFSCKDKKAGDTFEVSGTITNGNAGMVYLEEVPLVTMERRVVDSAKLGADGKYTLKTTAKESNVFNLRLEKGSYPFASVINDAAKMTLDIHFDKANNQFAEKYEVKGSKASQQLKDFMSSFNVQLQEIYYISRQGDSLQKTGAPDSIMTPLVNRYQQVAGALKSKLLDGLAASENAALSIYELMYYMEMARNPAFSLQPVTPEEITKILGGLSAKYPTHEGVAATKSIFDSQMNQQAAAAVTWTGKMAPEFSLADVNGKQVSLSSYKGKYVLVDFWASWCRPCREENPVVVSAYNKYKNKNFTILGVSLDDKKDAWLKAIKDDQLTWTHVSDLKGWQSAVVPVYNFGEMGIPFNVLLDPDGKVIAERLRGMELEAKLAEVLK